MITAGILSYYFTEKLTNSYSIYILFLPLIIGFLFSHFFIWGAKISNVSREHLVEIAEELELGAIVEYNVLRNFLILFAILLILVSAGIFAICMKELGLCDEFIQPYLIFSSLNFVISIIVYSLS